MKNKIEERTNPTLHFKQKFEVMSIRLEILTPSYFDSG